MMLCTIAAIFSLAFCTIVRSVSPSSNNWRQFSSATVQKKGEGGGYLVQVSMWGHSALQLSLRDFTCYDYTLYYNILWPYSFLVIWSAGVFFCTYMYHMGLEIILFLFFLFSGLYGACFLLRKIIMCSSLVKGLFKNSYLFIFDCKFGSKS